MHRFVIMSGTSGVGLSQLHSTLPLHLGDEWQILKFEDIFRDVCAEHISDFQGNWSMIRLLNRPEPILQELWLQTFRRVADKAHDLLNDLNLVLLMHCSWLATDSTSITTCIDPRAVVDSNLKCDLVINLIDDVYDVYERLDQKMGDVFFNWGQLTPEKDAVTLLQILEWRQVEFRCAQLLGRSLGTTDTIMLAVKHPMSTLVRLIRGNDHPRLYISHPISAIRRSNQWDGNPLLEQIQTVSAHLRAGTVLFEPTSIDELRIYGDVESEAYRLTRRWPFFIGIDGEAIDLIVEPLRQPRQIPLFNSDLNAAEMGMLNSVKTRLDRQINWRDRQLVVQSDSLSVLRPFSKESGEISGGVRIESLVHADLLRMPHRFPGIVFHPPGDERNRQVKAITTILAQTFEDADGNTLDLATLQTLTAESILPFIQDQDINDPIAITNIARQALEVVRTSFSKAHYHSSSSQRSNLEIPEEWAELFAYEEQLGRSLVSAVEGNGQTFDNRFKNRSVYAFRAESGFLTISNDLDTTGLIERLHTHVSEHFSALGLDHN